MPVSDRTARLSTIIKNLVRLLLAAITLIAAVLLPRGVSAQSGGTVRLVQADAGAFPRVSVYVEAYNASGQFIGGLDRSKLRLLEDGKERPLDRVSRLQTGVQFIVALNEAPEMANRYAGKSRFETMMAHLLDWARSQPITTHDDFSLSTNTGLQFIRLQSPTEWATALAGYQTNLLTAKPGLNGLATALDLAAEPNPNPFMKRSILYITALPPAADLEAYPNLANRAAQQKVRVDVWLVASHSAAERNPKAVEAVQQLAKDTGGGITFFSGEEVLPDLETWLDPMRYTYQVEYTSALSEPGTFDLTAELEYQGQTLTSSPLPLKVNVSPPNPIFLAPPTTVERTLSTVEAGGKAILTPDSIPLQILIEFPDGHNRPLAFTRLYVDGNLVAENTAEPFDRFEWPISGYTTTGTHEIQVEAGDILGLTRKSISASVQVTAETAPPAWWTRVFTPDRLIGFGAIFTAGLILVLVLFLRFRSNRPRLDAATRRRLIDPVTQPIPVKEEHRKPSASPQHPNWPGHTLVNPIAPAWLVPVVENGQTAPLSRPVALTRKEITLGSDPQQATIPLNCPTVSPLHARLVHEKDGDFLLADCGSVAGTWVNYAPISNQGVHLEHGDLIRLGRAAFRFELTHPPRIREPRVESKEGYDSN